MLQKKQIKQQRPLVVKTVVLDYVLLLAMEDVKELVVHLAQQTVLQVVQEDVKIQTLGENQKKILLQLEHLKEH